MWFEDFVVGSKRDIGTYTFTEDEIIAFAKKFDPQPFHIDPEAARESMFGGIIASGWHTAAIWMKLTIALRMRESDDGGAPERNDVSPGFEDMRWLKPVRPGVALTFSTETVEKAELRSRPELGLIKSRHEARDEKGELVFSFIGKRFVRRNPAPKS